MPRDRSRPAPTVVESTLRYEGWLADQTSVVAEDLVVKHKSMADKHTALPFFRATFYRWAEQFLRHCVDLVDAPSVLGVGDIHLDNFGTWRDAEGRLVWGINDFDEACTLPYTNDLVRLAAGALATTTGDPRRAAGAILDGYQEWLVRGGEPFVVEEDHGRLRDFAAANLGHPKDFWRKFVAERLPVSDAPADVAMMLRAALPGTPDRIDVFRRRSGLGSLGRPRFVATIAWHGGMVARETKRLVAPAWGWVTNSEPADHPLVTDLVATAVRCADPFLSIAGWWQTRRLAADCRRIDVAALEKRDDLLYVLRAMGRELANVHLANADAAQVITDDLRRRPATWLSDAAERMAALVIDDWHAWRADQKNHSKAPQARAPG